MSPLNALHTRLKGANRQLLLFLAGMALMGMAGGIFETTFNNFLADTFHIGADARGFLEFPRELPGFLTALFVGMLFFLPETMIAAVAAFALGIGMIGLARWGGNWHAMLGLMILWSIGTHLIMPVRSSISMDLAHGGQKGRRLGQVGSVGIAATIAGCALVVLMMRLLPRHYALTFAVGGAAAVIGGFFFMAMQMPNAHLERPKYIWRRQYWLYYVLSLLFGARKQIFITFGPWVLVKVFHQPAYVIAQLWIAASVLGILFQPALGKAIDRYGERPVLMADAGLIALVCLGYGLAHHLHHGTALWLLYACYVGDQLLFGTGIARDTYMSKIALEPAHMNPSLSLGVSINHIVSMSIPSVGGLLWMKYGHPSVFLAATGIALVMLFFSSLVTASRQGRTHCGCA